MTASYSELHVVKPQELCVALMHILCVVDIVKFSEPTGDFGKMNTLLTMLYIRKMFDLFQLSGSSRKACISNKK